MAISFVSGGGATNNAATLSFTVGTGINRLLVVSVVGDNSDNLTSLTYGGQPMTLAVKLPYTGDRWNYIYYIISPTSGTANIVATGLTYCSITVLEYKGVDQTTPITSTYSHFYSSPSTQTDVTLVPTTINNWLIGSSYAPGNYGSIGGTVIRSPNPNISNALFDNNGPASSGSQTISISNNNFPRVALGISIQPVLVAISGSFFPVFMQS